MLSHFILYYFVINHIKAGGLVFFTLLHLKDIQDSVYSELFKLPYVPTTSVPLLLPCIYHIFCRTVNISVLCSFMLQFININSNAKLTPFITLCLDHNCTGAVYILFFTRGH